SKTGLSSVWPGTVEDSQVVEELDSKQVAKGWSLLYGERGFRSIYVMGKMRMRLEDV
ncbi:5125_t:CDS:2, partial [Scutellospora calospora]